MIIDVTDETFPAEVLQSELPVLVDFWAPWCGPCKLQAPLLEKLALERADSLKVVKVNVDENPEHASRLAVRSIPSLIVFKGGEVVAKAVGLQDKAKLEALAAA